MAYTNFDRNIEMIRDNVNIVDVIDKVVSLKKTGTNYKGNCPFHNEKTPSFIVSEPKQIFKCFGCGESGNAISFIQKYYNISFLEAMERLAKDYNLTLEKSTTYENKEPYYEVNKMAARFFYDAFTKDKNKGLLYMKDRGISIATLKKYGIGYADETWTSLYDYLTSKGIKKESLLELGLVSEKNGKVFDKFRNRVMFPIISTYGKVIGFGGRAIGDETPKYLNSQESKAFQKKNNLYGLNTSSKEIGKEGNVILVEGYMDVIGLDNQGVKNAVATLGTALTENQARMLKRYTKEVILSYDSDEAGKNATFRGIDILRNEGCKTKILSMTNAKDPDEYIQKKGKDAFLQLIAKALPAVEYKLQSNKVKYNLENNEDRIKYIEESINIFRTLTPTEQEIYLRKYAKDMHLSEGALREQLKSNNKEGPLKQTSEALVDSKNESHKSLKIINHIEKYLLALCFRDKLYIHRIKENEEILENHLANKVYNLLEQEYKKDTYIDKNIIFDQLDNEETIIIKNLLENVVINGNTEEEVYKNCKTNFEIRKLKQKEKHLLSQISLGNEDDNEEELKKLTRDLMETQEKLRKIKL